MKTTAITISSAQRDLVLEAMIQNKDKELKELARKNARHFGSKNLPALTGDKLEHYTGELKTDCEKLAAEISKYLQPGTHFPEAKIEADYFREKDANLDVEIAKREEENRNDEHELGDFDAKGMTQRIRFVIISTLLILFGEIMFNTKAFLITGENLLFALILSISASFAISIFSHLAPMLVKGAKTVFQKIMIALCSLVLVTGVFSALAVFRSRYLAAHDVHVSPFYFVAINLFFFLVSAIISFYVLPTWAEFKQNAIRLKIYHAILKRKYIIETLKKEKEDIRNHILEKTKQRIRIAYYSNYAGEHIRRIFWHSLEIFKTTNLTYRSDRGVPDCFSKYQSEPEIEQVILNLNSANRKQ